jgi:hypothetical protein
MKYIDTSKVTEDSIYPYHAENRAVESGGHTVNCLLCCALGEKNETWNARTFFYTEDEC